MSYSYPYGGVTGLITFLSCFQCIPTQIDDGTGLYRINFMDNGDVSLEDLTDSSN